MTSGQKRDLRKLLTDALDEMHLSRDEAQRALGNGGKLKVGVEDLLAKLSGSDLLEVVATVHIPAIETFSAKNHFEVNQAGEGKIIRTGSDFRSNFLADDAKVEADIAEANLRMRKLLKPSMDFPIITELGGEGVAETSLGQMYKLIESQRQGQQGILLTNGGANVFFVRDSKGILWGVSCLWSSDHWHVNADPVTCSYRWSAGSQVFSR
jgi:hypothetical protein